MTKEQWEKEHGYVYGHNGRYCDNPEYLGKYVEYYRNNVHETTIETDKVEAEDEETATFLEDVIERHLVKFGAKDNLTLEWVRSH